MDRLTSMAVFVRVAEKGSFAAAAAEFGLSATMVANHVRALEDGLGARLLDRTTRRHALTEIGAAYLERCRDVLASVQAADQVADALRAIPQGTLRVSAPVSWGTHRLVPVLGEYLARHPRVRVELSLNDRVVDLAEEGFDCAFRSGELADTRLVARPLRRAGMRVAASPAYLARHGTPRTPQELAGHALLGFAPWGADPVLRFERAHERARVPVRGPLVINNGQALLAAALAGIGVAVQADALLDPAIERGELVPLLADWSLPSRALHVLRLPEARPSAKLRSFVDFVVERLG
ncbi:MAG: LysR family transcriptional regulator [Burkholderiales bacterium]|nr:LysR family transcriptional regulator [Burkholderiales bacterium]